MATTRGSKNDRAHSTRRSTAKTNVCVKRGGTKKQDAREAPRRSTRTPNANGAKVDRNPSDIKETPGFPSVSQEEEQALQEISCLAREQHMAIDRRAEMMRQMVPCDELNNPDPADLGCFIHNHASEEDKRAAVEALLPIMERTYPRWVEKEREYNARIREREGTVARDDPARVGDLRTDAIERRKTAAAPERTVGSATPAV